METATLAGGCFWCTEAVFQRLKGVISVTAGYSGGSTKNPSYLQVVDGNTGHAESIQITFDPTIISFQTLLDVFWATHNPTTPNQQGYDRGTEYRSIIFYHSNEQKNIAEESKKQLQASHKYEGNVITEIVPFVDFTKAEDYHQNYYNNNGSAPYCQVIIDPKIQKLLTEFSPLVDKTYQPA